ncbi:dihydrofolate reductase family protein [Hamadaea tsunoensis]|uniref:dihydrofolate reductase family protein n=1 Tax=Hamadaea tsunoensis TaxID=53368 RepID=UPI0004223511|nr:dihydrofolate reductase family protein [Hamadaea tsunoensis]
MGKISAFESITLDGVMQGPAHPEEDTRDGFRLGGWAAPYADHVLGAKAAEGMSHEGALLFGRRTYEHFFSVWPARAGDGNPFSDKLNRTPKYVLSQTLTEQTELPAARASTPRLPWENSILLSGDPEKALREFKETGPDATVLGSGELVRGLLAWGLLDEMVLIIHPLVLGAGFRIFPDAGPLSELTLVEALPTTTGAIIATYRAA